MHMIQTTFVYIYMYTQPNDFMDASKSLIQIV